MIRKVWVFVILSAAYLTSVLRAEFVNDCTRDGTRHEMCFQSFKELMNLVINESLSESVAARNKMVSRNAEMKLIHSSADGMSKKHAQGEIKQFVSDQQDLVLPSDLAYYGYGIVSTSFGSKNCIGTARVKNLIVKFEQCAKSYVSGYVGKYYKYGWKIESINEIFSVYMILYTDSACTSFYSYSLTTYPTSCSNDKYGGSSKYEVSSLQPAPDSGGYFNVYYNNKTKCLKNDVSGISQTVVVNGACGITNASNYITTQSLDCITNGDGSINITNYIVTIQPSGYYRYKSVQKYVNYCKSLSRYSCPPVGSPSVSFCPLSNPFPAQMTMTGFLKMTAFSTPDCSGSPSTTAYIKLGGCSKFSSEATFGPGSVGFITRGYIAYMYINFYDITDGMCGQSPVSSYSTRFNVTVGTCSRNSDLKDIVSGDVQKAVVVPEVDTSFPNGGLLVRTFQSDADYMKGTGHEYQIMSFDLNCNKIGYGVSRKMSCVTLASGDVSATASIFANEICSGTPSNVSPGVFGRSSLTTAQCFAPAASSSATASASGLSTAATIGIAVGLVLGVVLIAVAVFIGVMSCKKKSPVYASNN